MKSPKIPKSPPPAPPVSASSAEMKRTEDAAKRKDRKSYGWDKTIYRAGAMNSLPPGTTATLGK